jgi:hypothetical protein
MSGPQPARRDPAATLPLSALLEERPGGARRITLIHPRAPGVAVWAEATPDIEVEQLVAALESIPALERRVLTPGVGGGDLRRLFSEAWLRSKLEAIGARISSVDDRRRDGLRFLSVIFTVEGRQLVGVFGVQASLPLPLGNVSGVMTEAGVDLYVVQGHQAYGYCGNIFLNVSDPLARRPAAPRAEAAPSAVDIARALVRELAP